MCERQLKKSLRTLWRPQRFGGDGGIRTLARFDPPTAFRVRTLQPLGYISGYPNIMPHFFRGCKTCFPAA